MSFVPRLNALPESQRRLWPALKQVPPYFVLYGGTALALRLGHRESVDFDFFANQAFNPANLLASLSVLKGALVYDSKPNTLTVEVDRGGPVKISFFGGMSLGRVQNPERTDDGVMVVASLLDVAAAKMKVILERIQKRDYLDIWALLGTGLKLADMLAAAQALHDQFNPMISLRAVGYLKDGDLPSLPEDVKTTLMKAAGETCRGDIPPMQRLPGGLAPQET
jgi:hypothetical protein